MLKFLSRRRRSRKALLWIFVILLALGLVVTFTPALTGTGATNDDTTIAEVADYEITYREFREGLASISSQIASGRGGMQQGEDLNSIYRNYGDRVLNDLIQQKLILHEAEEHNLAATDAEVQERLRQQFSPWPGYDQYRQRLQQVGYTPAQFEALLRTSITAEKLRSFVTAGVQVPPQEVEEDYRRNNTNYTVRWVEVHPERFRDQVQLNEADLRAYFDRNKDQFRIATEQRRARYIFIDQAKAGETIQVSDEELRQKFDPEREVQQVRASQIVLNLPAPALPGADKGAGTSKEEVSKRAEEIVRRAQGADGKPAEDFAKLAREFSQDPKTKASGGDLGWINRQDKRETDDPLNRVFSMQKDEVSQPIIKGDKLYIIKVTDRKVPTFEETRAQLLSEARLQKGYTRAVEIANEAQQKFKESKNADAVVAEINSKYGAQVASVKETPFFAPGDPLPELGSASELETAVFDLNNQGDVSDMVGVNNGFAIAQYTEKREPHDATFEEVRLKVEERYREERASELARERTLQLAQAASPDALKSAAEAAGLKAEERAGLTGNDSIGPLVSEVDRSRVYALNAGAVTREPIKPSDANIWVVAGLVSRKDADMGEPFQKERASIEQRLLDGRRNAMFRTYLAAAQKRLQDGGDIEVYKDVIEKAMEGSAPATGTPSTGVQPINPSAMPVQPGRSSGPLPPGRTAPRRLPPGAQPMQQ